MAIVTWSRLFRIVTHMRSPMNDNSRILDDGEMFLDELTEEEKEEIRREAEGEGAK